MTTSELQFGNEADITLRKSRTKKEKPLEEVEYNANCLNFSLCSACKRRVNKTGTVNISTCMPVMCQSCRERFLELTTHTFVIGGLINLN